MNGARGIINGVILGALIWALVIGTIWQLHRAPAGAGEQTEKTEVRP